MTPQAGTSASVDPLSTAPADSGPSRYGDSPAWQSNHPYRIGDRVSYADRDYQCLQTHTSLPGWEPPKTPALWQAVP